MVGYNFWDRLLLWNLGMHGVGGQDPQMMGKAGIILSLVWCWLIPWLVMDHD